ncbi:MAG: hypothetical protein GWM92_19165 [Gemmatimonadetes bacterium]|nr:hypothetical protein [Gemmatimonadota bacterium]NIR80926.1 hypothetical protein [Gemmatimonadota bacterium]NIT89744.1 hypothetical protein [Gemmatimonadota bacterium]NIU33530.1 hypothetical protein [Gemmatimonadota bacterium]NIU37800.1 hypothetical protein [Gemmatimonadota bacterium]
MDLQTASAILESHGYWIAFVVGFAEFAGFPLASGVILVSAGALTAEGTPNILLVALAAAAGGFLADSAWYLLGRWKGHRVVDSACGLTSNPGACVTDVCRQLRLLGSSFVLVAKFFPGTGNLLAPAAGIAGLEPRTFLPRVAVALLAWAGIYVGVGRAFAGEVTTVLAWVVRFGPWAAAAVFGLIVGAGIWRGVRIWRHRRLHPHPEVGSSS